MPNEDFELGLGVKDAKGSINKTAKGLKDVEMSAKKAGKATEDIGTKAIATAVKTDKVKSSMVKTTVAAEKAKSSFSGIKSQAMGIWNSIKGFAGVFGITIGAAKALNAVMKLTDNIIQRQKKGLEDNLKTFQALSSLRAMERSGVVQAGTEEAARKMREASTKAGYQISEEEALAAMAVVAPKAAVLDIDLDRIARVLPAIGAMSTAGGKEMSLTQSIRKFLMPMLETGEASALTRLGFGGIDKDKLREMKTVNERVDATFSALEKYITAREPTKELLKMATGEGEDALRALAIIAKRGAGITLGELQEEKPETKERMLREVTANLVKWQAARKGLDITESRWEHIGDLIAGGEWKRYSKMFQQIRPKEGLFDKWWMREARMDVPEYYKEMTPEQRGFYGVREVFEMMRMALFEEFGIKPEVKVDVNEAPK